MNRILSYLILSVSIFWALPSCVEAGDDDGIIEDEYRELEIFDRALLPQIDPESGMAAERRRIHQAAHL